MDTRTAARRGLAVYFVLVVLLSGVFQVLIFRSGKPIDSQPLLVTGLMWSPGVASVIVRLVRREGFRDVAFGLRGPHGARMMLLAWLYPLVVGAVAYGLAWSLGLDRFAPPPMASLGLENSAPAIRLLVSIGMHLTLVAVVAAIPAAGEEIGWRGYMLTRLIDAEVPRPLLVSGLIWAAWHTPLILSGQYASGPYPILSAVAFAFSVTGGALVAARVRLESGSVWPAILFHATWNSLIQGTFDRFTAGGNASKTTTIWTGESGVLVVAVDVVLALLIVWRPWPARRAPKEPPFASLRF